MRTRLTAILLVLLLYISVAQAHAAGEAIAVSVAPGIINSSTNTTVQYTLTLINNSQISVCVYDMDNHTVSLIDEGTKGSGTYSAAWDGTYVNGTAVPDGIYQISVSSQNLEGSLLTRYLSQWGSKGAGTGQFSYPWGIAVSPAGIVYVADRDNNRVQVFGPSGSFAGQWGGAGAANGRFYGPWGIAVNSTGYVYVTDRNNCRVQVFDANGTFVAKWGSPGTGNGKFYYPEGIAVNSTGFVYVADTYNNRVQVFDSRGNYLTGWVISSPRGLAVNSTDFLYVVSGNNHRVQVYDPGNSYLGQWGSQGTGTGQLNYPWGIATDTSGHVYVSDIGNYRVEVFDARGMYLTQFGVPGTGPGQFSYPTGIGINSSGYIYVVDSSNCRVEAFGLDNPPVTISGSSQITVDNTPPVITGYTNVTANEYGWFNVSVAINFSAADNLSGLRSITGNTTLTAEAAGQSAVGTAVDNAGNTAYLTIGGINIDMTPPDIITTGWPVPNAGGWNNAPVTVSFVGTDSLSGIASGSDPVTLAGEGAGQSVAGTVTDKAGNIANSTMGGVNIDLTPPEITINSPAGFYLLNQPVTADWNVTDSLSGVTTISGTISCGAPVDTSIAGTSTYRVIATDRAGNTGEELVTYTVGYTFEGLMSPLGKNDHASFNQGSNIPVKFRLADASSKTVTGAVASLNLSKMTDGVWGPEQMASSKSKDSTGGKFRNDQASGHYIYNLDTKPLAPGMWRLIIKLDDGTIHTQILQLA